MILDDFTNKKLRYKRDACTHGHHDHTGRTFGEKTEKSVGKCIACKCGLPPGLFEHSFRDIAPYEYKGKYKTEEDRRKLRVAASMKWNAKNKEKFLGYVKKYGSKEEVSQRRKEWYANMPYEEKEEYKRKSRENYLKRKQKQQEKQNAEQSKGRILLETNGGDAE